MEFNWKHIVLVCIFFVSLGSSQAFAQKNIMKANMYYNSQLYSQAIEYFVKEIELNNKQTIKESMIKLANCYKQTGQFIEAEKVYRDLMVKYGKREPYFIFEYANALRSSSKYAEAIEFFEKYKKEKPDDPMTDQCIESCVQAEIWLVEPGNYYVRNMKEFNSSTSDASPIVYGDTVYFVSSRPGSVKKVIDLKEGGKNTMLDLYYVYLKDTNFIAHNKDDLKGFNTYMHEGPATFSPDRNLIYFTRTVRGRKDRKKQIPVSLQIYVSQKTAGGEWGIARSAFKFNDLKYSVAHPSISSDGSKMYFASDMKGGNGGTDIYVSEIKNGQWGKPQNLGDKINTFGNELTPFIYNDTILFFSSDAHPGMGKKDIFMSVYSNGEWGEVINLKPPINSLANDFGYVQYDNKGIGFFTSDRFNGYGREDIYSFIELTPIEVLFDTNTISIQDQSLFNEASYQIADKTTNVKVDVLSDKINFKTQITDTVKYTLYERREGLGYNRVNFELNTSQPDSYYTLDVRAATLPIRFSGTTYEYKQEEFSDFDTSYVKESFEIIPNVFVTVLLKDEVVFEGSSDEHGLYKLDFDFLPRKTYTIKVIRDTKNLYLFKGYVVDDKGKQLDESEITLYDVSGKKIQTVTTNENGMFSISASRENEYIISASKTGYDERKFKLPILPNNKKEISRKIVLTKQVNVPVVENTPEVKGVKPKEVNKVDKPVTSDGKNVEETFYSIQVLASLQSREPNEIKQELSLSEDVMKFNTKGLYQYTILKFDDVEQARLVRDESYKKYGAAVVLVKKGQVYSINKTPGKTTVEGKIIDDKKEPVKADIEFNETETNRTVVKTESSEQTGKYSATLNDGKRYGMVVTKDGYVFHSENINLTDSRTAAENEGEITKNIQMQKPVPGTDIVLHNVFFAYGKAEIQSQSIPELERVVALMREYPYIKLEVSGHTCNTSSWQFNKKLSQMRAYAVRDYLIARGVSPSRLVARGYSYDRPIADNSTEEGKAMNRRTEFTIIR